MKLFFVRGFNDKSDRTAGCKAWSLFRLLVAGTLQTMRKQLNYPVNQIMQGIDGRVSQCLVQALQLDAFTMSMEHALSA